MTNRCLSHKWMILVLPGTFSQWHFDCGKTTTTNNAVLYSIHKRPNLRLVPAMGTWQIGRLGTAGLHTGLKTGLEAAVAIASVPCHFT